MGRTSHRILSGSKENYEAQVYNSSGDSDCNAAAGLQPAPLILIPGEAAGQVSMWIKTILLQPQIPGLQERISEVRK
jgi:hypothetical protein